MNLRFKNLAFVAALVCFALSILWLLAPHVLLAMWGVDYTSPVGLVSRRSAALFLGVGVMFMMARHAAPSPSRTALTTGFTVSCLALATLGLIELLTGHASMGILSAVAVELAFAVAFRAVARNERTTN